MNHLVNVGHICLGEDFPIRLQSMTNTCTLDIAGTVAQCKAIADAGADLVRITAQGVREAEALRDIRDALRADGYSIPLVADIHFNPAAAEVAAQYVEKVRINPGNFVDRAGAIDEPALLRERLVHLLNICKAHKTALRIGINHGSLSARMLSKFGDTPQGMVESAMEFLRICRDENFADVVVSMKSSNTRVMVYATRQMALRMASEGMRYPLHLGVTEAGEGEDGRIKSAVGIGTLLAEGLGDTIRVSLTEDPQREIPVAKKLVEYLASPRVPAPHSAAQMGATGYVKRASVAAKSIAAGGDIAADALTEMPRNDVLHCTATSLTSDDFAHLKASPHTLLALDLQRGAQQLHEHRQFFASLAAQGIVNPVLLHRTYNTADREALQLQAAVDFGALLIDGFGDAIFIAHADKNIPSDFLHSTAQAILQAARVRFSKTEYIACPSCGRTLFDLQTTLREVKRNTAHLVGVKIAVMGCIVNGPGEMADADYGYVGASPGHISLYKGRQCVMKNIPQENAVEELMKLIDENYR